MANFPNLANLTNYNSKVLTPRAANRVETRGGVDDDRSANRRQVITYKLGASLAPTLFYFIGFVLRG